MTAAAPSHKELANAIRALSMDAVQAAKSGHPGMPMGMADVATVLFGQYLKFDPRSPRWPDRDRFVHSVGHGSMLLYALLYLTGYEDMTIEEIKNFRQVGSRTAGHPEYGHAKGIETTTGPLGQGIGNAVGMALAERHLRARFGPELVDHRIWVMAGDGCMQEGISHEAASLAGHQRLDRLTIFYDDNSVSIDGPTSLSFSDDTRKRYEGYGWHTQAVDGHDPEAVKAAIEAALADERPSLIACRTLIGFGAPNKAGTAAVHGAPLGEDEVAAARAELGWDAPPFVVPDPILAGWREIGQRSHMAREAWEKRLEEAPDEVREAFARGQAGALPADLDAALASHKAKLAAERPSVASRKSSQDVLEILTPMVEEMIGGSADLTGSNNTKTKVLEPITRDNPGGRYMYYGVREHGMVAAMNGIALHRGLIPYGGTFLVFSDYCRPSIRLAALMGIRVVLVMTHDSIGLGEDGPTHQPVEHLASLRAIPGLWVLRPADAIEVAECWVLALNRQDGPSLLALSRQNLPTVRFDGGENMSAKGAYVLAEASGSRQLTLLATGSEVKIALEARTTLEGEGIATAVVSMPCWELFEQQDAAYRAAVLGHAPRIAVEAASPFGWTRYVAAEHDVVGMTTFGASGPLDAVYRHFGITPEAVVERARAHL